MTFEHQVLLLTDHKDVVYVQGYSEDEFGESILWLYDFYKEALVETDHTVLHIDFEPSLQTFMLQHEDEIVAALKGESHV